MPEALFAHVRSWFTGLGPLDEPVYLVGGAVRDILLTRPARDIDLVCKNARDLARRLARRHQASLITWKKEHQDMIAYRVARRLPDGTIEEVDITPFRNGSLNSDLASRDFTINAMALGLGPDGAPGRLEDPLGGKSDLLQNRVVKMASEEALAADPLRVLRGFRFSATLNLCLDPVTRRKMAEAADGLDRVAGERIAAELALILSHPSAPDTVTEMDDSGVLAVLFPEIRSMKGCGQNHFHCHDVWTHSLEVMRRCNEIIQHPEELFGDHAEAAESWLSRPGVAAWLKFGALMHDAGKPGVRRAHPEDGRITLYGHPETGATMMRDMADRLKLSRKTAELLQAVVGEHLHVRDLIRPGVRRSTKLKWFRRLEDNVIGVIIAAAADVTAARGPAYTGARRAADLARLSELAAEHAAFARPEHPEIPLITGKDVLGMGVKPGPRIGRALGVVQQLRDDGQITTREQALKTIKDLIRREF